MSPYTTARFYTDAEGRTCCELVRENGYVHPRTLLKPGEFEEFALPWCEHNDVTIIDERYLSMQARERLDNEARLYRLEHRP